VPLDHIEDGGHDQRNLKKAIHDREPDFGFMDMPTGQIFKTIGSIDIHLVYPAKSALINQYGQ
jgi:hypothetical protein